MVAAMTMRLIVMPLGLLSTVPLWVRILVCFITVVVMVWGGKRRLGPALMVGITCLMAYESFFGA